METSRPLGSSVRGLRTPNRGAEKLNEIRWMQELAACVPSFKRSVVGVAFPASLTASMK